MVYKILFIDEEKDAFDDFRDYVDASSSKGDIEVITEFPIETMDEMLQIIFKHNPDAIVTDFMLNEHKTDIKYNVPFNGIDLVREFTSIREGFPCFVMTSFDDNAVNQSDDVNIVYIKNILHGSEKATKARANFLERVISQVKHYRGRISEAESELQRLINLRKEGKASIDHENKMIELDHFLERAIDKKNSIPEEYKTLSNTSRLDQILSKVDDLLKKVDDNNAK